jgi:hypothetical protein
VQVATDPTVTSTAIASTDAGVESGSGGASSDAVMSAFGHFTDPPASRGKYAPHEHGAKKQEQQRLTALFEETVSGDTHESEHTIGYEPLAQTSGLKRGKSPRARELENHAPAYQESKPMHRAHIGTGTTSERDESGFNSHEYRAAQRATLEAGDVSSAVQLNQLGYAHMPEFQAETGWEKDAADDSYAHMVGGMKSVTYAAGTGEQSVPVSQMQQVEMLAARDAARTGQWPDRNALKAAWAQLGYTEDD